MYFDIFTQKYKKKNYSETFKRREKPLPSRRTKRRHTGLKSSCIGVSKILRLKIEATRRLCVAPGGRFLTYCSKGQSPLSPHKILLFRIRSFDCCRKRITLQKRTHFSVNRRFGYFNSPVGLLTANQVLSLSRRMIRHIFVQEELVS